MLKYLDPNTLRARLAPAIVAAAPAFAFVALLSPWPGFSATNTIAAVGLIVLLFALSDFARSRGRRIEPQIFERLGGKPSIVMLRHCDSSFDPRSKARYLAFLGSRIGEIAPTPDAEQHDPAAADAYYERCGAWLRENTRNVKKFSLLFNENVSYGYRRNLFALKWLGLGSSVVVVLLCASTVAIGLPFSNRSQDTSRILVVLAIAAIHALYIGLAVREQSVGEAARSYARQLILSCESLLEKDRPSASGSKKKAAARRKAVE